MIDGYELLFIESVISVCKTDRVIKMINNILSMDALEYSGGVIFNVQGAFSKVSIENIDGTIIIRKKAKVKGIKQIKNEYRILTYLSSFPNEHIIKLASDSVDGNSIMYEYASNSLENYIISQKRDLQSKTIILLRICVCVLFLHNHNVIHRDLHPGIYYWLMTKMMILRRIDG